MFAWKTESSIGDDPPCGLHTEHPGTQLRLVRSGRRDCIRLGVETGSKIRRHQKLVFADKEPVSLHVLHFTGDVAKKLQRYLAQDFVFPLLQRARFDYSHVRFEFSAAALGNDHSPLFALPAGFPMCLVYYTPIAKNGTSILTGLTVCRLDRFIFENSSAARRQWRVRFRAEITAVGPRAVTKQEAKAMNDIGPSDAPPTFGETFDVIVVGYGFAGAMAAITAADAGAHVLLCEKEAMPGGISICSGGWFRSAHSADLAFEYLKATNAGRTPDDVLRVLADGMAGVEADVRRLAAASDATLQASEKGGNYPFPGVDTFYHVNIVNVPGSEDLQKTYPHIMTSPSACGWRMFKVMEDNIEQRAIDVRYEFAAQRLINNGRREILGVWFIARDGRRVAIKARRAVTSRLRRLRSQRRDETPTLAKGAGAHGDLISNTGDEIRMAQDVGADLWHMWHFHGSYGFNIEPAISGRDPRQAAA